MTKYILKKPIPNCDWKVGEVKTMDQFGEITYKKVNHNLLHYIFPHEIALLVHCGFLEEVKDPKRIFVDREPNMRIEKIQMTTMDKMNIPNWDKPEVSKVEDSTWGSTKPEEWVVGDDLVKLQEAVEELKDLAEEFSEKL